MIQNANLNFSLIFSTEKMHFLEKKETLNLGQQCDSNVVKNTQKL
jgi:hypothetical protein